MMKAIEAELRFIVRQADSTDAESAQLIQMAADSALQSLFEYGLSLQPSTDDGEEYDYPAPRETDAPVIVSRPVILDAEEMDLRPAPAQGRARRLLRHLARVGAARPPSLQVERRREEKMIEIQRPEQFTRAAERVRAEKMRVRLYERNTVEVTNESSGHSYLVRCDRVNGKTFGTCSCEAGMPTGGGTGC
jgi:hypothetical protein